MQPTISAEDQEELARWLHRLEDEHPQGFRKAMKWLAEHPELSRPALVQIVERYDGRVVGGMSLVRAAEILGQIGHPDDVAVLARALEKGGELSAMDFAVPLSAHPDPTAYDALLLATSSQNIWAVQAATSGLGLRKDEAARGRLEELLNHDDYRVRYRAVLSLIDLGARPSRAALKARKKIEKDDDVRGAIRKALK